MRLFWRNAAVVAVLACGALTGCGGDNASTAAKEASTAAKETSTGGKEAKPPPKPGSNVPADAKTVTAKVYETARKGIPADVGQWMVDVGVDPGGALRYTVGKAIVPPGNTNFHLTNPQATGHDIQIEEVGAGSVKTPVVREGSAWVRISLYEGKQYVFYCSIPGHREAGMEGTIQVAPGLEAADLKRF